MSHVVSLTDIEVMDLDCLKKACQSLGWVFHEGKTLHKWYTRWVDDSAVPRHLFATEAEYQQMLGYDRTTRCQKMKEILDYCDHVISVPGFTYEIGVFKRNDSYQLIFDWVGDITRVLGHPQVYPDIVNPLPQAYAVEVTKKHLSEEGWSWEEWKDEANNYHIKAVQYV